MVLREVDAVRCSVADLAVLGTDLSAVRAAMRRDAVLVVSDAAGGIVATGPFGEVVVVARDASDGDDVACAICAELVRKRDAGESAAARWHRALTVRRSRSRRTR
jgi:hypothetical protein